MCPLSFLLWILWLLNGMVVESVSTNHTSWVYSLLLSDRPPHYRDQQLKDWREPVENIIYIWFPTCFYKSTSGFCISLLVQHASDVNCVIVKGSVHISIFITGKKLINIHIYYTVQMKTFPKNKHFFMTLIPLEWCICSSKPLSNKILCYLIIIYNTAKYISAKVDSDKVKQKQVSKFFREACKMAYRVLKTS